MQFSFQNLNQERLRLIVMILACVLFTLSLLFGIASGFSYGQSKATFSYAQKINQALAFYQSDQGRYPSATQFYDQRILVPDYLTDLPKPLDASSACASYNQFFYSQSNPQNFDLEFCMKQSASGLSAGSHIFTEKGLQ